MAKPKKSRTPTLDPPLADARLPWQPPVPHVPTTLLDILRRPSRPRPRLRRPLLWPGRGAQVRRLRGATPLDGAHRPPSAPPTGTATHPTTTSPTGASTTHPSPPIRASFTAASSTRPSPTPSPFARPAASNPWNRTRPRYMILLLLKSRMC
jgi:hypothetical protein